MHHQTQPFFVSLISPTHYKSTFSALHIFLPYLSGRIQAYNGERANLLRVKIAFVFFNVLQCVVLIMVAILDCAYEPVSQFSNTHTLPRSMYASEIMFVSVIVIYNFVASAAFLVYGLRVAFIIRMGRRISKNLEAQDHSARDSLLLKATVHTTLISLTIFAGGVFTMAYLLALATGSDPAFQTAAFIIQSVCEIALIIEMLLLINPKKRKTRIVAV